MENICPIGAAAMRVSKTKTATLIWTNLCAEEKKNQHRSVFRFCGRA